MELETTYDNDLRPTCPCMEEKSRIIGGKPVGGKGYPFAIGLVYEDYSPLPICGGTLITDRHVLTAAHCLDEIPLDKLLVNVGDYNIRDKRDGKLVSAHKFTKYPKYEEEEFHSDIAIIELKEPVSFNNRIQTIPLPKPNFKLKTGSKVIVFGWGKINPDPDDTTQPDKLHAVKLQVRENDVCKEVFPIDIEDNMICAGGEGGKDSCEGDSGGGLIKRKNNQYVQVGVVSVGIGCGWHGFPGIYSRVSSYMDWILDNIQSAKCKPCIYDKKQ